MADETPTKPSDSAYLFNGDAQAILENAPDLDTGLNLLHESYTAKAWDEPDKAAEVAASFGQKLRYRFNDNTPYSTEEIGKLEPIRLSSIEGSDNVERVNEWEKANKAVLAQTKDPDYVINREKLSSSISSKASELRRLAISDERGSFGGATKDLFFRAAEGSVGSVASLVTWNKDNALSKALKERTDPQYDDDFSSDVASGVGLMVTGIGAGAAAPIAGGAYLLATGAGAIRERYQQSLEDTGDTSAAAKAAAIETVGQAIQLGGLGIVGKPAAATFGKLILGRELTPVAEGLLARIVKPMAVAATTMEAGGEVSQAAQAVGDNKSYAFSPQAAVRRTALGLIFGAAGGVLDTVNPNVKPDPIVENGGTPPPTKVTVTHNVADKPSDLPPEPPASGIETQAEAPHEVPSSPMTSLTTADGSNYIETPEGSAKRVMPDGATLHPADRTFVVDKDNAAVVGATRNLQDKDGETPDVFTDGNKLYVRSQGFVTEVTTKPVAEASPGDYLVSANQPTLNSDNTMEYRSAISKPITDVKPGEKTSIGAASIYETKEHATAQKARLNPKTDSYLKEMLGGEEGPGLLRYFTTKNVELKNEAGQVISSMGFDQALKDFLSAPDGEHAIRTAVGIQLQDGIAKSMAEAKASGNMEEYNKLADIAYDVLYKRTKTGHSLATGLQAYNIEQLSPEARAGAIRSSLHRRAFEVLAMRTGMTPEEIRGLSQQISWKAEELSKIDEVTNKIKQDKIAEVTEKLANAKSDEAKANLQEQKSQISKEDHTPEELRPKRDRLTKEKEKLEKVQKDLELEKEKQQATFPTDKEEKLNRLGRAAARLPKDSVSRGELEVEMGKLEAEHTASTKTSPRKQNLLYTYFIHNITSGIGTWTAKAKGDLLQLATTPFSLALGGRPGSLEGTKAWLEKANKTIADLKAKASLTPKEDAKLTKLSQLAARKEASLEGWTHELSRTSGIGAASNFVKGSLGSIPEAWNAAVRAFTTGKTSYGFPEPKDAMHSDFINEGPKFGVGPFTLNKIGYVGRVFAAITEGFAHVDREGMAQAMAYYGGKKLGLSGEKLTDFIMKTMHNSKEDWKGAIKEARSVSEDGGLKWSERDIKKAAWDILASKRPETIQEESQRFATFNTFSNTTPPGTIGVVSRLAQQLANVPIKIGDATIHPLKFTIVFTNIAGNLAHMYSDFFPMGLFRSMSESEITSGGSFKPETRIKDPIQQQMELGRFMIGAASLGTLYAIAQHYANDKDPYITITGSGGNSAQERALGKAQKIAPFSLKIGSTYIHLSETPLMFVAGTLGNLLDAQRNNKKFDPNSLTDKVTMAVLGCAGAFADHAFMKSLQTVLDVVQNTEGLGAEGKAKLAIERLAANTARGMIPGAGFLKSVANAIDSPIDQKQSVWATLISGVPGVERVGTKPALNVFGEPLERDVLEKSTFLTRIFSQQTKDDRFLWLARSGYNIPDIGNYSTAISDKQNPRATKARVAEYGPDAAKHLTPQEHYELIEKSGPDISKVVSRYMNRYGNSGYQEQVEARLKADILAVRNRWKQKLFLLND